MKIKKRLLRSQLRIYHLVLKALAARWCSSGMDLHVAIPVIACEGRLIVDLWWLLQLKQNKMTCHMRERIPFRRHWHRHWFIWHLCCAWKSHENKNNANSPRLRSDSPRSFTKSCGSFFHAQERGELVHCGMVAVVNLISRMNSFLTRYSNFFQVWTLAC